MFFRKIVVKLPIGTTECKSKKALLPPVPIAHVRSASGVPYVSRLRHFYIVGPASQLYRGDIIRTDDTTHVFVRFVD